MNIWTQSLRDVYVDFTNSATNIIKKSNKPISQYRISNKSSVEASNSG